MIICGLPTPWYMSGPCCDDPLHLDNITDRELGEVHAAVRSNSKACQLFRGAQFSTRF